MNIVGVMVKLSLVLVVIATLMALIYAIDGDVIKSIRFALTGVISYIAHEIYKRVGERI